MPTSDAKMATILKNTVKNDVMNDTNTTYVSEFSLIFQSPLFIKLMRL